MALPHYLHLFNSYSHSSNLRHHWVPRVPLLYVPLRKRIHSIITSEPSTERYTLISEVWNMKIHLAWNSWSSVFLAGQLGVRYHRNFSFYSWNLLPPQRWDKTSTVRPSVPSIGLTARKPGGLSSLFHFRKTSKPFTPAMFNNRWASK